VGVSILAAYVDARVVKSLAGPSRMHTTNHPGKCFAQGGFRADQDG